MTKEMGDDVFAERIAGPLRASERADATFEARAMSAVQAAARDQGRRAQASAASWWTRPRRVDLSPVALLAVAAGFAALVLGVSSLTQSRSRPGQEPRFALERGATDTVHIVRFVFVDSSARAVALVGEFNQWDKRATPLRARSDGGVWTVDVPLSAGRHEYAFVVRDTSGERWVEDRFGQLVRDEFGTRSSVISVGALPTS